MDISIFGFKLNLEVLILIGIIYLILVIHTVCGCVKISGKKEGMDTLTQDMPATVLANDDVSAALLPASPSMPTPSGYPQPAPASSSANNTSTSSKKTVATEGFSGANTNYGESANYPLTQSTYMNTSKWGAPDITIVPGKPIPPAAQAIINRPNQSLPLPEGQLSLFDNMPFSPECCPNTYSSSMGCACMNDSTYNYLITRAGNNVPYSEY
jgi:hypothetical protein